MTLLLSHPTATHDLIPPGRIALYDRSYYKEDRYAVFNENADGHRWQGFFTKSLAEALADFSYRMERQEAKMTLAGAKWSPVKKEMVTITVDSGCVVDVFGLPHDFDYEINDLDVQEEAAD